MKRTDRGFAVRAGITWDEIMRLLDNLDDVDHADYDLRDAEKLERWAAWIRQIVAARDRDQARGDKGG